MSNYTNKKNLLIGAAVAASIVGTLTTFLHLTRRREGWMEKMTRRVTEQQHHEKIKKNWMLGGITGGLLGASAALLFAPKSGSDLFKDLSRPFSHFLKNPSALSKKVKHAKRKIAQSATQAKRATKKKVEEAVSKKRAPRKPRVPKEAEPKA